MNPKGGEQPVLRPETPTFNSAEQTVSETEKVPELVRTPEASPSQQPVPPIVIPTSQPVVLPDKPTPQPSAVTSSTTAGTMDGKDKDAHKIEKQWVEKAKAVILQTRDDPFSQKNMMNKVKAEYIEKRFNKKLKTDDVIA